MKRILAAFMFFTRFPLWRVAKVPSEYFAQVVPLWPLVGWLTGGVMAIVLYVAAMALPVSVAVILALASRVLLTGALHDDGLADFCDGFGGGRDRDRILQIMKDSHIGTYGVLGLIFYYLATYALIFALFPCHGIFVVCGVVIAADVWSKFCASQIVNFLPYARTADTAKAGVVYRRTPALMLVASLLISCAAFVMVPMRLWWAALAPVVAAALLIAYMHRKIDGYTGDCCGATFMLCELAFYLTIVAIDGVSPAIYMLD